MTVYEKIEREIKLKTSMVEKAREDKYISPQVYRSKLEILVSLKKFMENEILERER